MNIDTNISFNNNQLTVDSKTIDMLDVIGIKYGYEPIRLDMYTIGSRYTVEFKTETDSLVVNFKSYFTIGKKQQYQKFSVLIDAVWESTIVRMLNQMAQSIGNGDIVRIGRCNIGEEGIIYRDFLITWQDLSYQVNYNRLTINSKSNTNIWTNLYFAETYNVHVFRYFLDWKFKAPASTEL